MSRSASQVSSEIDPDVPSGGEVAAVVKLHAVKEAADPAQDSPKTADTEGNNLVKRMVHEVCDRMAGTHELREELLARGVTFHVVNSLVECGLKGNESQFDSLLSGALASSRKAHGPQSITREDLREKLDELITVEKDLRHSRQLAANQGLHVQAMNHLTQIIRANPGDGGVNAINTLVAYADASGISLDRVQQILEKHAEAAPASVLPDIDRTELYPPNAARKQLFVHVLVGCFLAATMMWLVL